MKKGVVLLLIAEFCFALSTLFTKLITQSTEISAIEITFFRFFLGFFVVSVYVFREKKSLKPYKTSLVIWRSILNTASVILLFSAVQYSSVTNGNMLNMTYPIFIFLFSPFIIKEQTPRIFFFFLILSFIGIYLTIHPDFNQIKIGDIIGLCSGIVGAFSVISLRMARKYDSTGLILFYVMAIGSVINLIVMLPIFIIPDLKNSFLILCSAVLGVLGQIYLTRAYKFITAKTGGIISTSRIAFATFLGVAFLSENLTLQAIVGGILIIISLIGVNVFDKRKTEKNELNEESL